MNIDFSKLSASEIKIYMDILEDPIRWGETFLINPDTGEALRANHVQRKMLGAAKRGRKVVARVHRRGGKSYGLMWFALWYAQTHESAQILVVCPDQAKVHALFNVLDEFLRVSVLIKDTLTESTKTPALRKFKNGSTILGFTAGSRSKSGAEVLRGQTADVVIVDEAAYLEKGDWPAIEPIMQGDATRPSVISFVSSTPTADRNRYWELCTKENNGWQKVHVPVTDNPDYPDDRKAEIRAEVNDFVWGQEWLAIFPDIGEGVYRRSYIDRAKRAYEYYRAGIDEIPTGRVRTMGVDWDKSQGVGPNIFVIELDRENSVFRSVYHEEIEPTEYCLTLAIERIIELNEILNPQHIYVDRGLGEMQVEYLHLFGRDHPESGLATKVRGVSFSENVEVLDPATKELVKKRIKPVMVNITVKWMEDNRFIYPSTHEKFTEQLQDFSIVGVTDSNVKYTSENEHIIDAFCLAAYAMHSNYNDPFRFLPASLSYLLPTPEVVTSKNIDSKGNPTVFGIVIKEKNVLGRTGFARRNLPNVESARPKYSPVGGRRKF
jgi:hypothetical protein